jgi:5-methylcytosine-specific restriction protein A
MATFFLTYNPLMWTWEDFDDIRDALLKGDRVEVRWSTGGRNQGVSRGDRLIFVQQGQERGIFGAATAVSEIYPEQHWAADKEDEAANYVDVELVHLRTIDDRIPVEHLEAQFPEVAWGSMQSSGNQVPAAIADELWRITIGEDLVEEFGERVFREGGRTLASVSRVERSTEARAACIAAHGHRCAVCDFDFEERYGTLGRGFVHVHHLEDLASGERDVDPVRELRPVFPNCHAMLHRGSSTARSIEELQSLLTD